MLQDDLVLVTLPGPRNGEPIALVEALEDSLAMPDEGDTVRTLVTRTARESMCHAKRGHPNHEGAKHGNYDQETHDETPKQRIGNPSHQNINPPSVPCKAATATHRALPVRYRQSGS